MMRSPPPHPSTRFLDGLRGLAALYVLVHHALVVSTAHSTNSRLHHLLERLFHHGYPAVIFFFVLSGFVIHLRQATDPARPFGAASFFTRRLRRLYPPLHAALAITFAADALATRLGYANFYATAGNGLCAFAPAMADNHHWTTLLGNLAFLAQIHVPMYGTNGSLWSLTYEGWFYALYPLLLTLNRRSVALCTTAVLIAFALTAFPHGWPPIQGGAVPFTGLNTLALPLRVFAALPAWYAGMLLADAYASRTRTLTLRRFRLFTPLLLAIAFGRLPEAPRITLIALGFAGGLACTFQWERTGRSLRPLARLAPLGDCSYTLYVIHLPLVLLLWPMWYLHSPPALAPLGWILLIAAPLALAYALHFVLERPFTSHAPRAAARLSPAHPDFTPAPAAP